ncbi:hypothetical protein AV521_37805 [Streptomyces sp. IMTB 2501]|nr:hypothetical protein AV521_37805 [Streptomyces sp. IMTB 2501]
MNGALAPTREPSVAEQSKSCWHSTNHQVVIDADTLLVVAVGRPMPGNRDDCKAWELSGTKAAVGNTTVIADGGSRGTGLVIPHRPRLGTSRAAAHAHLDDEVRPRMLAIVFAGLTPATSHTSAAPDFS